MILPPQCKAEFKHCPVIPARKPWCYYAANRNMPSSCINLPLNPKKCLGSRTWPRNVKWLQRGLPNMGGRGEELCKEQTCWQKWSTTNDSIQIHKAAANLREWHQFPTGQPACLFFLCLLLNTKEMCISWASLERHDEGWIPFSPHRPQPLTPSPSHNNCTGFTVMAQIS